MKLYIAIAKFLAQERGAQPVFGLMGDANLAFLGDYIEHQGGTYVPAVGENGAVLMAYGYARASQGLGVATVTHGPALTNTLTGLTEAVRAKTPLVLLTGDTPDVHEFFQHTDIQGFAAHAGANFERVRSAKSALSTLAKAFIRARFESRPVVVDVPLPLMSSEVEYEEQTWPSFAPQRASPDAEALEEAAAMLLAAKRPLVVAGLGAVSAGAVDSLLELARLVDAPLMTSLLGRELFSGQPENLGIFGTLSSRLGADHIGQSDVVLALGASLNNWQTDSYRLLTGKRVIQVDSDPAALAKYGPISLGVVADAGAAAEELVAILRNAGQEPHGSHRLAEIAEANMREGQEHFTSTTGAGHVDAREAATEIDRVLPSGTRQLTDVGRFTVSVWPHISPAPGTMDYPGYFGSIGLGIATGVGVASVDRSKPTVVWAGDGGAMQGLVEITTAVRQSLPLIVVVINDGCYGAEYLKLVDVGAKPENAFMAWPSISRVAEGLGAEGIRVADRDQLTAAVARIEDYGAAASVDGVVGPLVIEVIADPHQMANEASVG
ncbi:MAG: thiamine pyrophosphate-binding protein [Brevibacterium sp.]